MLVRDIMTSDVYSVSKDDSTLKAASIMRDANIGSIPVREGDNTIGIVTDRDIVLRQVAEDRDNNTICQEIMSNDIVYVSPDTDVKQAADIMARYQIRRLPVMENGCIVGMVSLGDIATKDRCEDDAEEALTNISTPCMPQ